MSDAVVAARPAARTWLWRSTETGLLVGGSCLLLFAVAAWRLATNGYVQAFNVAYWGGSHSQFAVGGQWAVVGLLRMVKLVPGTTPGSLAVVTVLAAAAVQGWFARLLVRRGWTPPQAALAAGLTALHPVMLFMATSGSPLLLVAIAAGAVVTALDRVEAIGDAQSTITLGLAIAALVVVWPNAIYLAAIVILAVPFASREVRSASAAFAMLFISSAPTLILVTSFGLGASLFGVRFGDVLAVWRAPLHGAPAPLVAGSAWLLDYGGQFWQPLLRLLLLCLVLTPRVLAVIERLVFRRSERARPVTAIFSVLAPSCAGAMTTLFWHMATPFAVVALSMSAATVWTITTNLRPQERGLWIATILLGIGVGWGTPLLWHDADSLAWRAALGL